VKAGYSRTTAPPEAEMRYMLLIYADESTFPENVSDEPPAISPAWVEYTDWLLREGIHEAGEQLAMSSSATTVRVHDGARLVTDGPYAETKEVLGGYYIIECDDIDKALEAAARCPGAATGSIEVRPLIGMAAAAPSEAAASAASVRSAG
jgi:hypothetical protein